MLVFIYTLSDETGVRYIGQSIRPKERYWQHKSRALCGRDFTKKGVWLRSLLESGSLPKMDIIEECSKEVANEREAYWIKHYNGIGMQLVNDTHHAHKPPKTRNQVRSNLKENLAKAGIPTKKLNWLTYIIATDQLHEMIKTSRIQFRNNDLYQMVLSCAAQYEIESQSVRARILKQADSES